MLNPPISSSRGKFWYWLGTYSQYLFYTGVMVTTHPSASSTSLTTHSELSSSTPKVTPSAVSHLGDPSDRIVLRSVEQCFCWFVRQNRLADFLRLPLGISHQPAALGPCSHVCWPSASAFSFSFFSYLCSSVQAWPVACSDSRALSPLSLGPCLEANYL